MSETTSPEPLDPPGPAPATEQPAGADGAWPEPDEGALGRLGWAAARGAVYALVCGGASLTLPRGFDLPGRFALGVFLWALASGLAWLESRAVRREQAWWVHPLQVLGIALVAGPLGMLQAAYADRLAATGSLGDALSGALEELRHQSGGLVALWFVGLAVGLPDALSAGLRRWAIPLREKWLYAGAALGCGALSLAPLLSQHPFLIDEGGREWQRSQLPVVLSFACVPALALLAAWLEGDPAPAARATPLHRMRLAAWLAGAVLLPGACFGLNTLLSLDARGLFGPAWAAPTLWTWWDLCLSAQVQWPLYPLVLWTLVAMVGERWPRRGPWVQAGLEGAPVLAALFCVLYLRTFVIGVGGLVIGVGLLLLAPYVAFVAWTRALARYRSAGPSERAFGPRAVWVALAGSGLSLAAQRLVALHATLPKTPPDECYLATAGARGHPGLTGAAPVTFADGRVAPITRQLRVYKLGELVLLAHWPALHRGLRRVYDRFGPPLARRLRPRAATLAFLALVPGQWLVEVALRLAFAGVDEALRGVYPPRRRD